MAAGGRSQRRALLGEDDATLVFETSKGVEVVSTFDQMNLRDDLLRGIYAYGEAGEGAPSAPYRLCYLVLAPSPRF